MSILKKIVIICALVIAIFSVFYYSVSNERFYFSGIYVTAYFGDKNKETYINDPKSFFEKGEFKAIFKTFFYAKEILLEEGDSYSLISLNDRNELVQKKNFNIIPHEYHATVYNTGTGKIRGEERFQIMFSAVLSYSDKVKKIELYKGSMLIGATEVKKK